MKGRIIEINGDTAIVFTKSGTFVKTKNFQNASVGDEISLRSPMAVYSKAIASAAAALFIIAGGITSYCTPVSYVDICINPEIELGINMFDIVVSAEPKNDDGSTILAQSKINNKKVDKAIDSILSDAENLGFIPENEEKTVVMSVFAKNENNAKETYEDINSYKVPEKINKVVKLASTDELAEAKEENIPVGKYLLVNELSKISEDIPKEEIKKYPVKKIITAIDKAKGKPSKPDKKEAFAPEATQKPKDERIIPSSKPEESNNDIPVIDYFKDKPTKNNKPALKQNNNKKDKPLNFRTPEPVFEDIPVAPSTAPVIDSADKEHNTSSSAVPASRPTKAPVNIFTPEPVPQKNTETEKPDDEPVFRPSWNNRFDGNNKPDNEKNTEQSVSNTQTQAPDKQDSENNNQDIPEMPKQNNPDDNKQNIPEIQKQPDNRNPAPDYSAEKEPVERNNPRDDFENPPLEQDNEHWSDFGSNPPENDNPSGSHNDNSYENDNPRGDFDDNSTNKSEDEFHEDNTFGEDFSDNSHKEDNSREDFGDNSHEDNNFQDYFEDNSHEDDNSRENFDDNSHEDSNDFHGEHGEPSPNDHPQGGFEPRR